MSVTPDVSAMLLAAGESLRMGAPKQLLPIRGRPALVWCLEAIHDAGIADVVVVVRPEAKEIRDILKSFPVKVVFNELPGSDMAASVQIGLFGMDDGTSGILVCLCDYPLVRSSTLMAIRREHRGRPGAIIVPTHQGRKGHPVLFPLILLKEIVVLSTLRDILHRYPDRVVTLEVGDEGILLDMDTPEDYRRILERCRAVT